MTDTDSDSLSDIIFQRSREEQLLFERAFAPILALLVGLTGPSGVQGWFVIGAAVALVIIAFLRWLTQTGRFSNDELFIEKTVRPVELFAIIGVVQLFKSVAEQLAPLTTLTLVELTAGVSLLATIVFLLFVEIVFGTYRLGWGTLFYTRYRASMEKTGNFDSSEDVLESGLSPRGLLFIMVLVILGRMWMETAYFILKGAIPDQGRDKYIDELAEFVAGVEDVKGDGRNLGIVGTFVVSSLVVIPLFFIVGWLLSFAHSTIVTMILALVIMRLTKHIVGYSYIAFGTLRFDQFITSNLRSIGLLATYTLVVYLLFFYPA